MLDVCVYIHMFVGMYVNMRVYIDSALLRSTKLGSRCPRAGGSSYVQFQIATAFLLLLLHLSRKNFVILTKNSYTVPMPVALCEWCICAK